MSRIRVGIFGMRRGKQFIQTLRDIFEVDIVAVCDKNIEKYTNILIPSNTNYYMETPNLYTEFDEFIQDDFDVILLFNHAHQHAPFAIKAMRTGKHVLSECVACVNLKEAVELIEAVEETGKEYALLDQTTFKKPFNYFKTIISPDNIVKYESEDSYNTLKSRANLINNNPEHWRNYVASTTYTTHEMGGIFNFIKKPAIAVTAEEFGYCAEQVVQGKLGAPASIIKFTFDNGVTGQHTHLTGDLAPDKRVSNIIFYGKDGRKWIVDSQYIIEYNGNSKTIIYNSKEDLSKNNVLLKNIQLFFDKIQGAEKDYSLLHDVYEAVDITLPGILGFKSITQNGAEIEIPNLRDKAVRDLYRNDTTCTFPDVAGNMYISAGIMRNDNKDYVEQ